MSEPSKSESSNTVWIRWLVVGAVVAVCGGVFFAVPVHTYKGSPTTLVSLFLDYWSVMAESGDWFVKDALGNLLSFSFVVGPLAVFAPAVVAVEWGWGLRAASWRMRTALGLQAVVFVVAGFGLLAIIYINGTQMTFGPTDPPRGVTYWNRVYALLAAVALTTAATGWLAAGHCKLQNDP